MSLPEGWAHGNCFSGPCIWTLPSSHIELGGGGEKRRMEVMQGVDQTSA